MKRLVARFELFILRWHKEKSVLNTIQDIFKEDAYFLFSPGELFMVHSITKTTHYVPGSIAEVGVFRGSSAKMIAETEREKDIHLFDTFMGLPETSDIDVSFRKGMFNQTNEQYVTQRLEKYTNVYIHPGYFPDTGTVVADKTFSFVHLDVDTCQSTKDALAFFYPRMAQDGIILSHDYAQAAGVRKAFDDFFTNKKERIIELSGTQCLIIKK